MWSCFMKPFSTSEYGWGGALEGFYAGQADVYDATRQGLLKGRTTMMRLAAAHLRSGLGDNEKGNLVWVDVRPSESTDFRLAAEQVGILKR
jgi:betaine lipid synthase